MVSLAPNGKKTAQRRKGAKDAKQSGSSCVFADMQAEFRNLGFLCALCSFASLRVKKLAINYSRAAEIRSAWLIGAILTRSTYAVWLANAVRKEKLAYGLGDSAANFVVQTQITFLMFFYTDVFGISAGAAGTILLVSRVIDAFNDPIVGALADRTNSRWGRYRPWVLWTAVPMAIALVLCFTTPPLDAKGKIVWAVATYNLLMIIYAANNIPYCALSGVMTGDPNERTSLVSWRFLCAMATALVVNMFTLDLVKHFGRGDAALGYQCAMAFWGAIAVAFFFITFAFTKERVSPSPKQRSTLKQDLLDLVGNGPWIALFALAMLIHFQLGDALQYDAVLLQVLLDPRERDRLDR